MRLCVICILFIVSLFIQGCQKPNPMPGVWDLYIPEDMKAQAVKAGTAIPNGTFEFKANGECSLNVDDRGKPITFNGTYKRVDLNLEISGTEKQGSASKPFTAKGSLSDDYQTLRIYGKDFRKRN